jgi:tetratricopeptide (TPR) repeat protein
MRLLVVALVVASCAVAHADDESDADASLRAAIVRSQTDAEGALADLEALGARRPVTRWSDNAWSEAARLAEASGDFSRARRALEQVIAIDQDAAMVRRARATIDRLAAITGGGQWDAIARDHERLVSAIFGGGDPHAALAELAALVRANPAYPRAVAARTSIARGYEMEDDVDLALTWMRAAADAAGPDERGQRTRLELARMAIRAGALEVARTELAALRTIAATDRPSLRDLDTELSTAERRQWMRRGAWAALALLGGLAVFVLRRDLGSLRAVARRAVRPPIEVLFMLPIAGIVVGVAATGNPLVARAIITIVIAGIVIAWLSGVLVDVARETRRLSRRRLALHLLVVALAVAAVVFIAVERGSVVRLLVETWRGGHAR